MKQKVANRVASYQRGVSPRAADSEFQARREVSRIQALIRKRASLVNGAAIDGNPVIERTGRNIKELAEKILAGETSCGPRQDDLDRCYLEEHECTQIGKDMAF